MTDVHATIFALSSIAIFVAVDVYLALDRREGNTYSEILRNTGNRHPWFRILFLVAIGVLLGHWFW